MVLQQRHVEKWSAARSRVYLFISRGYTVTMGTGAEIYGRVVSDVDATPTMLITRVFIEVAPRKIQQQRDPRDKNRRAITREPSRAPALRTFATRVGEKSRSSGSEGKQRGRNYGEQFRREA